jgi:hypothetical protein
MIKVKNILGYGNELSEMRKAKLINTLDKQYRYDGVILHRYEFIINRIVEGLKLELEENYSYYSSKIDGYTKPKTLYKLKSEDDSYYEIIKIEYDFATWLINNDITTIEKVRELEALEDNKIKNIKALEAEKAENEYQEKLRKEKEENDFKIWIESEWKLYSNSENLETAKLIYIDMFGDYPERSCKMILTLIDNIDNDKCKNKLIEWLGTHNSASRKVFYHITGIKLPNTNKGTEDILKYISSNDFKESIEYKIKVKEESKVM